MADRHANTNYCAEVLDSTQVSACVRSGLVDSLVRSLSRSLPQARMCQGVRGSLRNFARENRDNNKFLVALGSKPHRF